MCVYIFLNVLIYFWGGGVLDPPRHTVNGDGTNPSTHRATDTLWSQVRCGRDPSSSGAVCVLLAGLKMENIFSELAVIEIETNGGLFHGVSLLTHLDLLFFS